MQMKWKLNRIKKWKLLKGRGGYRHCDIDTMVTL